MAMMRTYSRPAASLHQNLGGPEVREDGARSGRSPTSAGPTARRMADLDNDGWLDIYATCGFISQDRNEPDG